MKKISLFLISVMLLSGMAIAQNRPDKNRENLSPEVRAEKMTERMSKELSLNDEQKQQVKEINLDYINEMRAGKKDQKQLHKACVKSCDKMSEAGKVKMRRMDKAEIQKTHKFMNAARESRDLKLSQVLNKEQFAKYEQNREERKVQKKND